VFRSECGTRSNVIRRSIDDDGYEEDSHVSREQWRSSNVGGPIERVAETSGELKNGTREPGNKTADATKHGAKSMLNAGVAFSMVPNETA
jgi:hypothetical protein